MPADSLMVHKPISSCPRAGDKAAAEEGLARWRASLAATPFQKACEALIADRGCRDLLEAIFGNSPYLTRSLLAEAPLILTFLTEDADSVFSKLLMQIAPEAVLGMDETALMRALRIAKRRAALLIAVADIAGWWPLEQVTRALSALADAALRAAIGWLLLDLHQKNDIALPNPKAPMQQSGLVVLGLGKLGALELNYSSDIDLIILFERDKILYRGTRSIQECFVKLARHLVRLLQEPTVDGYVFRVDLRLRPDPASTPLVLSTLAAETYYESIGQNWERAALIKARFVAGDEEAGARFLQNLRPFVWRKHLDFATIADIHSIKRQIHAVKGHRTIAVAGHNIKLGRGGIREVEFFAQTQQLIWGGRLPELRPRATCDAIRKLVDLGKVDSGAANDLIAAYRYLRHVEHRLQMIDDQQTQTLPESGPALERLAIFCGHENVAAFSETLLAHLGRVEDHYAELFEEAPALGEAGNLVFTGTEDDPETVKTLQSMGFPDGSAISAMVRGWHHGRYRATRSARARALLTELIPSLLAALARAADPDTAFRRFDGFLEALPAGVQIFSLLQANPELLDLLAEIMGSAPLLADRLRHSPALLDGLLASDLDAQPPGRESLARDLEAQLAYAGDFQDTLDFVRRWTNDQQFQIGIRLLGDRLEGDAAGRPLADIADTALCALYPRVVAAFEQQHGTLPGRGMAVVALGKLGSREMSITSDLDLIFIYDTPDGIENWDTFLSDGAKPLAPIQYFSRLAQRTINALTVQTATGGLFEVDMRLRPSGNSGPIASGLAPFENYQRNEAWTWEHMALTRARVVCGNPVLGENIDACLKRILCMKRSDDKLRADILDMRKRMLAQHRGDLMWDIKHYRGGQVDVDFIAQYLQLRHAAENPAILAGDPAEALRLAVRLGRLDPEAGETLIAAARFWRRLQQIIRLLVGGAVEETSLHPAIRQRMAKSAGVPDFDALKGAIKDHAAAVLGHFEKLIGA